MPALLPAGRDDPGWHQWVRSGRRPGCQVAARTDLALVHVNELNGDAATSAHLLEFDTVHGRLDADISCTGDTIGLNGRTITHSSSSTPWYDNEFGYACRMVDLAAKVAQSLDG